MPDGGLKQRGPAARAAPPASGEGLHSDSDGDGGGGGSSLASADQGSIGARSRAAQLGFNCSAAESRLQHARVAWLRRSRKPTLRALPHVWPSGWPGRPICLSVCLVLRCGLPVAILAWPGGPRSRSSRRRSSGARAQPFGRARPLACGRLICAPRVALLTPLRLADSARLRASFDGGHALLRGLGGEASRRVVDTDALVRREYWKRISTQVFLANVASTLPPM